VRPLIAIVCVLSAAVAACDSHAVADERVLHERVRDLKPNEGELVLAATGQLAAIEHGGKLITEPQGGPLRADEAPMTAAVAEASTSMDQPGTRSTVYYPDRQTSLDGTLNYFEVFSPAISPFKRVTALDHVVLGADGRTPGLSTSVGRRTRVVIEAPNAAAPDARPRDQFWGSVVLDFAAGDVVPLPSVSPESRIFSLTTEPTIPLRVEKDDADNFFAVRASRNTPDQVRVTFLTDAPRSYFGAALPAVASDTLRDQVAPLERSIQRRAERFAGELGVRASDPLSDVLGVLTEHFRSFRESSAPPPDTGDTYLDLARSKKGICRHRAYAFVITSQALGIPTRFVQNEAHSWVEVKVPSVGWMRIDLGGAAGGVTPQRGDGRPSYQPSEPDRLPRPQAYVEAYQQAQEASETVDAEHLERAQGRWVEPNRDSTARTSTERSGLGLSKRVPMNADDARGKRALTITLDHTANSIYRGGMLQVSGRVIDEARAAVAGIRIEVALGEPNTERNLLLGVTVSNEQGYFQGSYGIPTTINVGDYELRVITPGDDRHLPAVGR